jgi:hypothetical protein
MTVSNTEPVGKINKWVADAKNHISDKYSEIKAGGKIINVITPANSANSVVGNGVVV